MTSHSKAASGPDTPLCTTCETKMRTAGTGFVCEGCGAVSGFDGIEVVELEAGGDPVDVFVNRTPEYVASQVLRRSLGTDLFRLLVLDSWCELLGGMLSGFTEIEGLPLEYYTSPRIEDSRVGRHFLGGYLLMRDARKFKERALGEKIDDDRFKQLIEEILHDELERYGIVLRWFSRRSWEGGDRVLHTYFKDEPNIPEDS